MTTPTELIAGQAKIAVWGAGREGRAALAALRRRDRERPLHWLVSAGELEPCQAFVTANIAPPVTLHVDGSVDAALGHFDLVVKSPGISLYRPDIIAACHAGTRFTSGSAIWFAEHPEARTLCVTGTKGKSTTAALIAHLLRRGGQRVGLAGNIGWPLLDLELEPEPAPDWHVIELSSYQSADLDIAPQVVVLTNLVEEHLDWHGSLERYRQDKLRLLAHAVNVVVPPGIAVDSSGRQHRFGVAEGWHVEGDWIRCGDRELLPVSDVPLPGWHNAVNLCAALTAIDAAGLDAASLLPGLAGFQPLPHRLQELGVRDGVLAVNDSIATTPTAMLAAWQHYRHRPLVLIVGGHERGLDWRGAVDALATRPPLHICAQGANGARLAGLMTAAGLPVSVHADLAGAVGHGLQLLASRCRQSPDSAGEGVLAETQAQAVLLLSPGAPSFPQFTDYTARGQAFARAAGYDSARISQIQGLGVA